MRAYLLRGLKAAKEYLFGRPHWGLMYLLLIPVFAFIYDWNANDFYQTSATHEPSYLVTQYKVTQAVADGVTGAIHIAAVSKSHSNRKLDPSQLGAYGMRATATATDIIATVELATQSKTGDVAVQIDIPEDRIPPAANAVEGYVSVPYSVVSITNLEVQSGPGPDFQLFEEYNNSAAQPELPLTLTELTSVQQLSDAAQGLVGGLPDQFSRMLYFSAVTVTTLGFGDITPVTVVSRSLVTLEAVLGVTFVGLFLNSLRRK
jgi:hypothetical protein